jgi:parallel beta-helix repeat protein
LPGRNGSLASGHSQRRLLLHLHRSQLVHVQIATRPPLRSRQANTIFGNVTAGIDVEATARNVTIQGNFIGTSSANAVNIGNGTDGVLVNGLARQVTIGGIAAGAGNVISGNKGNGIHLTNVTQTVQILGNLIGTSVQGTAAIGNARDGVFLEASSNALIQGNTISGNGSNGVELSNGSSSNTITSNKIGVGVDGATALGNKGFGVWAHQGGGVASSNNTIGGRAAGAGNVIGYNTKGVVIGDNLTDSSQQNAILGDAIFQSLSNGVPGLIDLGNNGPTYAPSGTAGPNRLEVPPTLTSATVIGSDLTVKGLLNGTLPNTTYRIEIFAADPTFGSFRKFLVAINVTTDANGNVPGGFTAVLTGVGVAKGTEVSATATDQNGNTTGFATAINAGSPPTALPPGANAPAGSNAATPPTAPVGSLNLFALGLGPTGIDLFEVDSQGEVFAQGLFGGGLQLVDTSLQLSLALMSNDGLLALLSGSNGQNYLLDVFDPFLPLVEPAVLAALGL